MKRSLLAALALAFACTGCSSDDDRSPPAPGGPSGGVIGVTGDAGPRDQLDAGEDTNDEDAGAILRRKRECKRVDPTTASDEDIPLESRPSNVSAPDNFRVTRELATWTGGCTNPSILIELSDGRCPDGAGHTLRFDIAADAITDGRVSFGENVISPDGDMRGIRVRYTRPEDLTPTGIWGTCAGSSGTLMVGMTPLETDARSNLVATFRLTLTDCSEDLALDPLEVNGVFNIASLYRGLDDYCPDGIGR
jgi:hypothetical protein